MSSASLAVSRPPHLDGVHIAALSVALALNLAAMIAALRPIPPGTLERLRAAPELTVRWISQPKAPPLPPSPPPLTMKPLHKPVAAPTPVTRPAPAPAPALLTDQGSIAAPPVMAPSLAPVTTPAPTPTAGTGEPAEASLAYRAAPLKFPTQAVRQRMHGTVILRVLVDEQGKPVDVVIEQSSGYGLLDRSAREQVLKAWRFEPAMVAGRQTRAWARVPVSFDLRSL